MKQNFNSRIIITGGHLTPALAVVSELKKRGYNKIIWVGHKYNQTGNKNTSAEFNSVNSLGIKFINLKTGKLIRKWNLSTFLAGIKNLLLIPAGFFQALFIVIRFRPSIIISFGGYIALPIVVWGRFLGAKVVTHEQTIVTGLANKFISRFAHKVFVSWENSLKFFPKNKVVLTGNPIRREIFVAKSNTLTSGLNPLLPTILVYGGNQGAHEINKRIFAIVPLLLKECNIIHQTGNSSVTQDFETAQKLKNELDENLKNRYVVRDYIGAEEVGEALTKSDIIVGRSGANNVSEILALGKISILIPIPWVSHNEQELNARIVEETGLGYILKQDNSLNAQRLYQAILLALSHFKKKEGFNGKEIESCREISKKLVNLDAPTNVVNEVVKLL